MTVCFFDDFRSMSKSVSYDDFEAIRISSVRNDFLVKGPGGEPIFLLSDSSPIRYVVGRTLKYIKAEFHVTCSVKVKADYVTGQFAMISCGMESPELHEIFLRCVGATIGVLPPICGTTELENIVVDLLEIFRVLSEPAANDISGFWAELWVIAESSNIPFAVDLWHSDVYDRYDFSSPDIFVEIKSTTKNFRIHDFSLEQLNPPETGSGFVISVMLQLLSGGVSVLDLVENIEVALFNHPQLKKKLWSIVTKTLGNDFSEKIDKGFDSAYASRNVSVYLMTDIPSVGPLDDARISNVKFSADLSTICSSLKGNARANLESCFAG